MARSKQLSEQMRSQSREKLISAAKEIFAEKGYYNCKVSDIARRAGMSQGSVYWYFPSKEELLKTVLAEGFNRIDAVLTSAVAHPGNAAARLEVLIDHFTAQVGEGSGFTSLFLSLLGHSGAPLLKQMGFDTAEIGARYHRLMLYILAPAQTEGLICPVDPNFLAVFFFSLFNGFQITYPDGASMLPLEELKAATYRLLGYQNQG
jgi:AcrR family transcriptional regulator